MRIFIAESGTFSRFSRRWENLIKTQFNNSKLSRTMIKILLRNSATLQLFLIQFACEFLKKLSWYDQRPQAYFAQKRDTLSKRKKGERRSNRKEKSCKLARSHSSNWESSVCFPFYETAMDKSLIPTKIALQTLNQCCKNKSGTGTDSNLFLTIRLSIYICGLSINSCSWRVISGNAYVSIILIVTLFRVHI